MFLASYYPFPPLPISPQHLILSSQALVPYNNVLSPFLPIQSDLIYDKLSVLIDVLAEEAAVEKSATVCADSSKADGKPFIPQIDHIAKCKLELATKAKNLQKSLKLIVFQVEQGKGPGVVEIEVGQKESSGEWFTDLPLCKFST